MGRPYRTAACLAVGSELLGDQRLDRNSLEVTRELANHGVAVREKRVVGDDVDHVAGAIRELLASWDVVVITGGLGPTEDDVTREAVARALGRSIERDREVDGWIRDRYRELDRPMPELCSRMALVVEGSRPLRNRRGTAPGLLLEAGDHLLAVFPGVPWEMEAMLERDLLPAVRSKGGFDPHRRRTLILGGVVESETEDRIRHLYSRFGRENITILASYGVLRLLLLAEGPKASAEARLDEMEQAYREILGNDVAGVDAEGLPEIVSDLLRARRQRLAVAESCTGGLMSAQITDVAGASGVFDGGVVSYSNEAKESFLGVPRAILVEHGAVSEEVARSMATGVRDRFGADWGVGITGIAGPSGGTEDKPVGLVHWAVAGPGGGEARHAVFPGARPIVRQWSVNAALDLLRRRLQS